MNIIQASLWIPDIVPGTNGILRFYSLFILAGIIVSVLASWIKLKRREIPTEPLEWSVFLIIPASILGATILGKINSEVYKESGFLGLFMFWKPGLSVHGGVLAGTIVGFFWFRHYAKKYEISLWVFADAIIPNILLGQVIGRWGNFFNHELLGQIVTDGSLDWLPAWLKDNLSLEKGGPIRQPLFLYESILNLISWIIITFTVPKIGMWFSVKPWKKYPGKYLPLLERDMELIDSEVPRYAWLHFKWIKKLYYRRLWKLNCWNQAYFERMPVKNKMLTITKKYLEPNLKANNPFFRIIERWFKTQWIRIKELWTQDARPLENNANPDGYWMTRVGVQTGCYVLIYNIVRMVLEFFRDPDGILIPFSYGWTYGLLILGVLGGLIIIIFAQKISVLKWRQIRWLYEKQY